MKTWHWIAIGGAGLAAVYFVMKKPVTVAKAQTAAQTKAAAAKAGTGTASVVGQVATAGFAALPGTINALSNAFGSSGSSDDSSSDDSSSDDS